MAELREPSPDGWLKWRRHAQWLGLRPARSDRPGQRRQPPAGLEPRPGRRRPPAGNPAGPRRRDVHAEPEGRHSGPRRGDRRPALGVAPRPAGRSGRLHDRQPDRHQPQHRRPRRIPRNDSVPALQIRGRRQEKRACTFRPRESLRDELIQSSSCAETASARAVHRWSNLSFRGVLVQRRHACGHAVDGLAGIVEHRVDVLAAPLRERLQQDFARFDGSRHVAERDAACQIAGRVSSCVPIWSRADADVDAVRYVRMRMNQMDVVRLALRSRLAQEMSQGTTMPPTRRACGSRSGPAAAGDAERREAPTPGERAHVVCVEVPFHDQSQRSPVAPKGRLFVGLEQLVPAYRLDASSRSLDAQQLLSKRSDDWHVTGQGRSEVEKRAQRVDTPAAPQQTQPLPLVETRRSVSSRPAPD